MLKILCNTVLLSPVTMCAVLAICGSAIASESTDFTQNAPIQNPEKIADNTAETRANASKFISFPASAFFSFHQRYLRVNLCQHQKVMSIDMPIATSLFSETL
jgi:hypothetical protein